MFYLDTDDVVTPWVDISWIYWPKSPGGEASRGHQWVGGMWRVAKCQSQIFKDGLSKPTFLQQISIWRSYSEMQLSWIPPKCSNGSCLEPPFWGSQCTGNQNKEWKSGRKLYVVIRYIPDFNWDIPCNNNQIYSNISSLLDSNFNSSIGNLLLSFTCNYNVVKKIYQDNLKHRREEVRFAVFFPTNLEDFIWGQFFSPGKTWCSNEEGGKNNNKYKKLYISLVAEIRDVANFYQIFILK